MMSNIYYRHVRLHDVYGRVLATGGATLRIEERTGGMTEVTAAVCNVSDHYNKKLGRIIVDARAKIGKHTYDVVPDPDVDIALSLFKIIEDDETNFDVKLGNKIFEAIAYTADGISFSAVA